MRVRLLYFAVLRDIAGTSQAEIDVPIGTSIDAIWQRLRQQYGELAAYRQPPLVALNEEYVAPDQVLRDGDELAFIPPVAGG